MRVREELPADEAAVARVVAAAFGRRAEAELVRRLHQTGAVAIALVAEQEGEIVGHLLLSPMEAPFRALALAPLAVQPERQNQGVGSTLVRAALGRAAEAGWQGVFVLGDPGYYGRFGFSGALAADFRSPFAGAHLMAAPLTGELPCRTGDLRHAAAFLDRAADQT